MIMFVQLVTVAALPLSESTYYYNAGPHGQRGELGTRSGQYDSSGFFYMHISSAACLVIVCLLVLMGE